MEESSISGRLYNAKFTSQTYAVWVSYEPGDEILSILIFSRCNSELSDIDDRARTPRLNDLNSRYMASVTKDERLDNEKFFKFVVAHDKEERLLLKAAKELRLVLPKYIS